MELDGRSVDTKSVDVSFDRSSHVLVVDYAQFVDGTELMPDQLIELEMEYHEEIKDDFLSDIENYHEYARYLDEQVKPSSLSENLRKKTNKDIANGDIQESKKIKLSNLSAALRMEVKKHLSEGRTKLSQMPVGLKNRVLIEYYDYDGDDDGDGLSGNDYAPKYAEDNMDEYTTWLEVYDILCAEQGGVGKHDLTKEQRRAVKRMKLDGTIDPKKGKFNEPIPSFDEFMGKAEGRVGNHNLTKEQRRSYLAK